LLDQSLHQIQDGSNWYALFPNPVVAESLLDRLINTSHQILMDGPSYRPRKRPRTGTDQPTDVNKELTS
jgi:DNA replication protein DnaC